MQELPDLGLLFAKVFKWRLYEVKGKYYFLSYDVASGSEIKPCNKIDKPLVGYRLTGNVMTSIHNDAIIFFYARNEISK